MQSNDQAQTKINYAKNLRDGVVFELEVNADKFRIVTSCLHQDFLKQKIDKIVSLILAAEATFLILVPTNETPEKNARVDEAVTTVICRENDRNSSHKLDLTSFSSQICYHLLSNYLREGVGKNRILVREFGDLDYFVRSSAGDKLDELAVVIPHRGDLHLLERCLSHMEASDVPPSEITVYIDEEVTPEHKFLSRKFDYVKFNKINPHGLGPYVARQHLCENTKKPYICFQDSDDIPTLDRFSTIQRIIHEPTDLCGSHELRLDDFDKCIYPVRYPLDVSDALSKSPSHSLLHPTSFGSRVSINRAGGFSTVRRFGSDTHFLLRSHFSMKISNVNKFLYIRNKRQDSLTTHTSTSFDSAERISLDKLWKSHFHKVKSGEIELKHSALEVELLQKDYLINGL